MKIKKILVVIITIMLMLLFIKTEAKAINENSTTEIKLITETQEIEKDVEIPIQIYIKNTDKKVESIDTLIEFNEELFYEIEEADITTDLKMDIFEYEKEHKNLKIVLKNAINEGVIATIKLKPKKSITEPEEEINLLKLNDIYIVNGDFSEETKDSVGCSIGVSEKLYLSSDVYKIGDNDIDNYESGDRYLEKITPETTVAEFINNCKTNGTIKVLNSKGEALKGTDLVGTNMTIKVTKDSEEITLIAVVMGDLDGNGLVTVTDLSGVNQAVLKTIELKDAIFKAADLDDNNQIAVTDLSGINQTILKAIKLTYDKKAIKK